MDWDQSFQQAADETAAWVPNLIGALVILLVGYLVARVVSRIVRRALDAAGADRVIANGTAGAYAERVAPGVKPSSVLATITFWFIFGSAILLAVSALGIDALSAAVSSAVAYLPNVLAAALILLVAIAVAGAVGGLANKLAGDTMLGRIVQTAVPVLVMTIALFMALVQLQIATQIVIATYVLVLGAIALGFALAFGLGGRDVARAMLMSAYETGREELPRLKAEARVAGERTREALPDMPTSNAGAGRRQPGLGTTDIS